MLVVQDLVNAVISAIDAHVQSCTIDGKFDPSKWDQTCYLQSIYDYVKSNAEITITYTGTILSSPDGLSGSYKYHPSKVSSTSLKNSVISSQSSVRSFPPNEWWSKLINSIQIEITGRDLSKKITLAGTFKITPKSVKSWSVSDFDGLMDYRSIWRVWCSEIIKALKDTRISQVTPQSVNTTSSAGGTGSSVFVSIS